MPTENRSSNTEQMVSARVCAYTPGQSKVELQLIPPSALPSWLELGQQVIARPAAQPQGEQFTYSSKQATNCAGCGTRKHTPLRVDEMGGYVCLTCIDQKLESLLSSQEHQGKPVAYLVTDVHGQKKALRAGAEGIERHRHSGSILVPLYTHADAGEVERLRAQLAGLRSSVHEFVRVLGLSVDGSAARNKALIELQAAVEG
ncbi:hypothetical protein [Pseudomonas sp. Irchel 3F5]|uniref:hypothetical protein n=1 Tax=Pseudomonas sp. Irchel 3F5 TaxID=2009002 RepID=UPI000BA2D50D|nr:hypothetical protein [Pseudomonas sp. Irchel 3F5]